MYNRYLSSADEVPTYSSSDSYREIQQPEEPEKSHNKDAVAGLFSNISNLFGGKGGKSQFSLDNIVLLAIIYFLIADSDEIDNELLIIVGILLFLGV